MTAADWVASWLDSRDPGYYVWSLLFPLLCVAGGYRIITIWFRRRNV